MDHVTHQGHEHFASVPSKLVVASDGPLQILGLDVERRIEIIVQVATPHHFPNACIAVELGTSKLADRYPTHPSPSLPVRPHSSVPICPCPSLSVLQSVSQSVRHRPPRTCRAP